LPIKNLMRPQVFIFIIVTVLVGILQLYSAARDYFDDSEILGKQITKYQRALEEERLRAALVQHQADSLRQRVATLLPDRMQDWKSNYEVRNIASIVRDSAKYDLQIDMASSLLRKGKELFQEKKYDEANKLFLKLTTRFPLSKHVVEAHFLLSEGHYLMGDYDLALDSISVLMTQYPESDLAGFSLVRLGNIFEYQERFEDAAETYRTILKTYKDPLLRKQAKTLLQGVVR
jgi:TolA-binding protein